MRSLVRAIDAASRACGVLAAAVVLVLIVLMEYDAVLRYVVGRPTLWAFDISTYLMGGCFVLAIGYTLSRDSHVRVDLLYDWIPRRVMTVVDLIGFTLILLPILLWITAGMWEYFREAYVSGERSGSSAWNPKLWPFRLVVFVGFAAFCLQLVAEIVKRAGRLLGRPLEPETASHELPT